MEKLPPTESELAAAQLAAAQKQLQNAKNELAEARTFKANMLLERIRLNQLRMKLDASPSLTPLEHLALLKEIFFPTPEDKTNKKD